MVWSRNWSAGCGSGRSSTICLSIGRSRNRASLSISGRRFSVRRSRLLDGHLISRHKRVRKNDHKHLGVIAVLIVVVVLLAMAAPVAGQRQ